VLTPLSFAVVLACSLCWSGYDLTRKLLVERVRPTPLLFLLTLGQAPLLLVWAAFEGWGRFEPDYWAPAAASVALNVVANLAFIHAFRAAPISITIPLLSLTPAFTALAAIPLLGELPTPRQDAGIALVVGGAVVVHLRRDVALADRAAARRGALLMVLVALCWSVTPALDKLAVRASSAGLHGFVLCAGVAAAVLVILVARGRLGETREAARMPGTVAVALVLSALALGLQLVAIQLVWVSLVETLKRGLGNLAALAYGRWLLGEAISRLQVAGVGLMAAGVALILI
jgi:drug/metabolite transporter (DMT)-like permease